VKTLKDLIEGAGSILNGYRVTIKEFFQPPVTLQYPWEREKLPLRHRGRLTVKGFFDKDSIERKSEYYRDLDLAPCMRACPAYTDIRGYITAVAERKFTEGIAILKGTYPFAGTLGRVCHAPCEEMCSQQTVHSSPLAIRYLKRFLADCDRALPKEARVPLMKKKPVSAGIKVAVIGAGPSGLTCAWDLVKRGYDITVFEKLPFAGGLLATGIPTFRLPREILKEEIDAILELGVELRLGVEIGRDISFPELFSQGFRAVYIATGAAGLTRLGCPGEQCEGVMAGEDFLEAVNCGKPYTIGKKVVVIGGGNTAIDCARVARRLGSLVTLIYRRTQREMPADCHDIKDCQDEGVVMEFLTAPGRVIGEERVEGLECYRCTLGEPDASGRQRPVLMECSEFELPCDSVITAISRSPDLGAIPEEIRRTGRGTIEVVETTGATSKEGVFAGGDVTLGPATVIDAIACARRAAQAIDRYLKNSRDDKDSDNQGKRSSEESEKQFCMDSENQPE